MTERQIRSDIRAWLRRFCRRSTTVRLIEEMEICAGRARADMAVIGDQLVGIEIKGPQDCLARLPGQAVEYSRCFDQVVLVVDELLAQEAMALIPTWWGVVVGTDANGTPSYRLKRRPRWNRGVDLDAVLALLWRGEIAALCNQFLSIATPARTSKRLLRKQLLDNAPREALKAASIELLRQRQEWRSVPVV